MSLYKNYCTEEFDDCGRLTKFEIHPTENFNFGYDVVDETARQNPDKLAMQWCNEAGEERKFTFGDISRLSNKAANALRAQGIKKGDRVMLILKRHYEYWYVITALHKLGAIAIPATHMLSPADIEYRVQNVGVTAVVCTPDGETADHILQASKTCPTLKHLFIVRKDKPGFTNLTKLIDGASDELERVDTKKDEPLLLYFSSGTTGYPKAVVHSHTYPMAHILTAKHWQNVKDGGLHLTVSDTGWGKASWGKIYGQWFCGSAVMVYDYDKFSAPDLMNVISKYKVTSFCAPPTIYRFLVKNGLENYDLSCLKYAANAGEALNAEVHKLFKEKTGLSLMEGYGQTESVLLIGTLVNNEARPGRMGKASPFYNIQLMDNDGNFCGDGEEGEIVVVPEEGKPTYGIFTEYYNNPELYKSVWEYGVYHTGDLAVRDEDGYFTFVGRKDDIIKSSGYKIGPFEIESVLMQHPAVLECAITGAPDPVRGIVVKATIILTPDYRDKAGDELKKELQNYVKEETAPYKYPRIVEFVDELPKTISGKIRRVEIRSKDDGSNAE